jgi:hypothetical protein
MNSEQRTAGPFESLASEPRNSLESLASEPRNILESPASEPRNILKSRASEPRNSLESPANKRPDTTRAAPGSGSRNTKAMTKTLFIMQFIARK